MGGEGREGRAGNQTGFMPPTEPTEGTNNEARAVYILVFALPSDSLLHDWMMPSHLHARRQQNFRTERCRHILSAPCAISLGEIMKVLPAFRRDAA